MLPRPRSSWCITCAGRFGREEIGSAFRGSSALHAVGDSYLLLTRPSAHLAATVELRFQFRYAAPPQPRLLELDPLPLCFSAAGAQVMEQAECSKRTAQLAISDACRRRFDSSS
jgi:hypothetical protein